MLGVIHGANWNRSCICNKTMTLKNWLQFFVNISGSTYPTEIYECSKWSSLHWLSGDLILQHIWCILGVIHGANWNRSCICNKTMTLKNWLQFFVNISGSKYPTGIYECSKWSSQHWLSRDLILQHIWHILGVIHGANWNRSCICNETMTLKNWLQFFLNISGSTCPTEIYECSKWSSHHRLSFRNDN